MNQKMKIPFGNYFDYLNPIRNIKIPKMSLSILAVPGKSKQCKILFGNCRNKKDLFLIVYGLNRTGCQIHNTGA